MKTIRFFYSQFLLFIFCFVFTGLTYAQSTFEAVTSNADSGNGSFRQVVQNATPGALIIFSENLAGDTIKLTSGPIVISQSLKIYGPEDGEVYISGGGSQQIMHVQTGIEVTLRDMHLIEGNATGGANGGAIYNEGNLHIQQIYFAQNTAQGTIQTGGAIASFGGAVANDGNLYAQRCVFKENILREPSGIPSGGALANFSYASLRYCTFEDNEAIAGSYSTGGTAKGGAVYNNGRIDAYGCSFTRNTAEGSSQVQSGSGIGGAINNLGYFHASASTFSDNSCGGAGLFGGTGFGGAIFNQDTLVLEQVTISGNEATGGGRLGGATGAGIMTYGFTRILSSTITDNTTSDSSPAPAVGGGMDIRGQLEIGGTIIAGNLALKGSNPFPQGSDANKSIQVTPVSLGYNLIGINTLLSLPNTQGNILNPIGFTLEPLADNGGPALTHNLPKGSIAIDAGNPTSSMTTDQRGYARGVNGLDDIGALEQGPCEMQVTNSQDDGPGSIRHALSYAEAGCTIRISSSLAGQQIILLSGEISVTGKNLKLEGIGQNQLFLRSDRTSRLLKVQPAASLSLSDISMVLGNAYDKAGGAIVNHGQLTLSDIAITNCFAFSGNAIFNDGDLSISRCKFERNGIPTLVFQFVAGVEGGVIYNEGTLLAKESTFSNNIAGVGRGGGVAKGGALYNIGIATIHTSTFSQNSAGGGTNFIVSTPEGYGGAIYSSGELAVTSCLFSANEAKAYGEKVSVNPPYNPGMGIADGGAIYANGDFSLRNSTFSQNLSNLESRPDQFSSWATSSVGGVFADEGSIDGCTFVGNGAGLAGAVSGGRALEIGNSLFSGNTGNFTLDGGASAGFNLIDSLKNSRWITLSSDLTGTVSTPIDPMLGTLSDNGGPTHTFALRSSSPAINAGNTDSPQDYDQRGYARPADGRVDIGAFEANSSSIIHIVDPMNGDSVASTYNILATAEISGLEIPYLQVICPDNGHRRLRMGNNPNSIWGPRVDVTAGGNDRLIIRVRDPLGTIDWQKIGLYPNGVTVNPIKLTPFLPANPGTDWITLSIPLSNFDFRVGFERLAYMEFPFSQKAGPFELHIGEVTFTGGTTPYRWFGLDELDNINDGNGAQYRMDATLKGGPVAAYVTSVQYELDGNYIGEDDFSPYSFEYGYLRPGIHKLTAVAILSDGNCFRSPPVDIVVTEPDIEITSPGDSTIFQAPATLTVRAEVEGITGPDYLKITCPDNKWRKVGIGHNPNSIWGPNVDPLLGGNNKLEITLRDPSRTANWAKMQIRPQGSGAAPVVLGNYIPQQGIGENWVTISIPITDFDPSINLSQISYLELPFSNAAGPFEIHIQQIQFTGGLQPFLWLGPGKMDNANNGLGNTGQLLVQLIRGNGNGPVTQVDFYANGNFLGTDLTAPYSVGWFQIPAGNYNLIAEATLSNGLIISSPPVNVMISGSRREAVALEQDFVMDAFPNPVSDRLTLNFQLDQAERLQIHLLDLTGKRVLREQVAYPKGEHTHSLNMITLPAGSYILWIHREFGEPVSMKIVKR
jgi:hypothetical protein